VENEATQSTFNPEMFMNTVLDEANSTEYVLVPPGEYKGVIEPLSSDAFKEFTIKKGENAGKKTYRLDLSIALSDDTGQLKELLGRVPKVRYGIMLEVNSAGGLEIGKGRNVQLGRLREAVGQNVKGMRWNPPMLGGQPITVKVVHDMYDGKPQTQVKDVSKY